MVSFQIKNKVANDCAVCGTRVLPYHGLSSKAGNKWFTVCASTHCQEAKGFKTTEQQAQAEAADIKPADEGRFFVTFPYNSMAVTLIKSLMGARFNREPAGWYVDGSPVYHDRIRDVVGRIGVAQERIDEVLGSANLTESQKASQEVTEALVGVAKDKGAFPYQLDGVRFLSGVDKGLLADDMGLGKTVQVLLSLPSDKGTLVVAPKAVLTNWRNETKRWRPDLTARVLSRLDEVPAPGEILIINYDQLRALLNMSIKKVKGKDTKVYTAEPSIVEKYKGVQLIADEAHMLKNTKSQRSIAYKALASVSSKVWPLTGTPLANRPPDLWGVLDSNNMAKDVFGSWNTFMKCFNAHRGRFGIEWGHPSPEVPERLKRVMLRRRKDEVLKDLPSKIYSEREVELGAGLAAELDELMREWYDVIVGAEELPDFESFSRIRKLLAIDRIPHMLDIVEEFEEAEEPLVVFSSHVDPIRTLGKRKGWGIITGAESAEQRGRVVEDFQAGRLKGIGLTTKAGNMGLTLTAASTALFVDLEWRPSDNAQAEDRICRIGQTAKHCQIIRMVSNHPLDRHVFNLLVQKQRVIFDAIDKIVTVEPPKAAGAVSSSNTNQESREQWEARVRAFETAQAEMEAQEKMRKFENRIDSILTSQRERATRPELELTPVIRIKLAEAHDFMLGRCDGALLRDGVGFNKPDASIASILEVNLGDDRAMRALERMLTRYHKQLEKKFPELFPN